MYMEPSEFWNIYVGTMSPLEFMYKHKTQEPAVGAHRYLENYPNLYGIVRRADWHSTFSSDTQFNREEVKCALTSYIDNSRAEWESQLNQIFLDESQSQTINEELTDRLTSQSNQSPTEDSMVDGVDITDDLANDHDMTEDHPE